MQANHASVPKFYCRKYEPWHVISNNVHFDMCRLRWACAAHLEA